MVTISYNCHGSLVVAGKMDKEGKNYSELAIWAPRAADSNIWNFYVLGSQLTRMWLKLSDNPAVQVAISQLNPRHARPESFGRTWRWISWESILPVGDWIGKEKKAMDWRLWPHQLFWQNSWTFHWRQVRRLHLKMTYYRGYLRRC